MPTFVRFAAASLVLAMIAPFSFAYAEEKEHDSHHPAPPQKAICVLMPTQGSKVRGVLTLKAGDGFVQIMGKIEGLEPGMHGFHIHEFGDLSSQDGMAAGGHYDPSGHKHGGPESEEHHAGDLGNIDAEADGTADVTLKAHGVQLHFLIGRSLVVHAKADDLKSQPAGNSGPRVAVGVIGIAAAKEMPAKK